MRRFEACPSRPKIAALFLGNLLLMAAAAWCITQPQVMAKLAGVAGVLFFGIGLYAFPRA